MADQRCEYQRMTRKFYTRSLYPRYDDDGKFIFYECSNCGRLIDGVPDDDANLEKRFLEHIKSDHPTEIQK
jgi:hypothetical protein